MKSAKSYSQEESLKYEIQIRETLFPQNSKNTKSVKLNSCENFTPQGSIFLHWLLQFFECQLRGEDVGRREEQLEVGNGEGFGAGKSAVNIGIWLFVFISEFKSSCCLNV